MNLKLIYHQILQMNFLTFKILGRVTNVVGTNVLVNNVLVNNILVNNVVVTNVMVTVLMWN